MSKSLPIVLGGLALGLAGFVLTHLGAYPQITAAWWYTALATFVGLNTLGFAVYATLKLGYQSGRHAVTTGATVPRPTPPFPDGPAGTTVGQRPTQPR